MRRALAVCALLLACADPSVEADASAPRGGDTQPPEPPISDVLPDRAELLDAAPDGAVDAASDVAPDAAPDQAVDASVDAALDVALAPDLGVDAGCLLPSGEVRVAALEDGQDRATVAVGGEPCARTFSLQTAAGLGEPNPRELADGSPVVRTPDAMFDALYALAVTELGQAVVEARAHPDFAGGQPMPCGVCFLSADATRLAYAIALGAGDLYPEAALNEVLAAVSVGPGGPALVQSPGTGGGWPVATDRVAWAFAIDRLLDTAPDALQDQLTALTPALQATAERDRAVLFDATTGLYRGEQSFLDRRDQTYPAWTGTDAVHIAESQTLSTNLAHLGLLRLLDRLQEDPRWSQWANDLQASIMARLWLPDRGLLSTYLPAELDRAPVEIFDLLGSALALRMGVGEPTIAARYPHLARGATVVWPQQQLVPPRYNRAQWPFVTALWAHGAARVRNDAAVDRAARTLMRGAAFRLSNVAAFEMQTWTPTANDQQGVVAVAGYLGFVHGVVFGLRPERGGLRVEPSVTQRMRNQMFAAGGSLVLVGWPYRGRQLDVEVVLPPVGQAEAGALRVADRSVDGVPAPALIPLESLPDGARIQVTLEPDPAPPATITQVAEGEDFRALYGPRTPAVTAVLQEAEGLRLTLDAGAEADQVTLTVFRDGVAIGDVPGDAGTYLDRGASDRSHCYTVAATWTDGGNASQHARARCWWGRNLARIHTINARDLQWVGGNPTDNHGRFHHEVWGDPGHTITAPEYIAVADGRHYLQVTYANGAGPVDDGVTCGVKRVRVLQGEGEVGVGYLVMPHRGDWGDWALSNLVPVDLQAGQRYSIVIDDAENMSAFAAFADYDPASARFNRVNIAELKILGTR